jgi:hypothetical protein
MPAALSAMGPKVSSATTMPVVDSMPMPARATRYTEKSTLPSPRPRPADGHGDGHEGPHGGLHAREMPSSTVVAGPVRAALAMSCTGLELVEVKYCGDLGGGEAEGHADDDGAEHAGPGAADGAALGVADVAEGEMPRRRRMMSLGDVDAPVDGLEGVGLAGAGLHQVDRR